MVAAASGRDWGRVEYLRKKRPGGGGGGGRSSVRKSNLGIIGANECDSVKTCTKESDYPDLSRKEPIFLTVNKIKIYHF